MGATTAQEIIEILGLEPLPEEGGLFRNTLDDGNSTAIYFLLEKDKPTMFHRLPGAETFHFYMGDPARITILGPGREFGDAILATDLKQGHRPQVIVPANTWQAAETMGEWTLLGTTMSPGYRPEDFELATRDELGHHWPEAAELIERHTPA